MRVNDNQALVFRHATFNRTLASGIVVKGSVCLKFICPLDEQEALQELMNLTPNNEQLVGSMLSSLDRRALPASEQ